MFSMYFICFDCSICIDPSAGKDARSCYFCLETVSPGQLNKVQGIKYKEDGQKDVKQKLFVDAT